MTITQRPSPHGNNRVEILENGRVFVVCPADHAAEAIAHHVNTTARHFGEIADRQQAGDPRLVVTGGHAYSIGSADDYPLGFAGRRWKIRFFDGRVETTVSLWYLGKIPADWRERIVDNAAMKGGF